MKDQRLGEVGRGKGRIEGVLYYRKRRKDLWRPPGEREQRRIEVRSLEKVSV